MIRAIFGLIALAIFGSMAYGAYLSFSGGAAPALPGFIPADVGGAVDDIAFGAGDHPLWRNVLWAAAAGLGALGGLLMIFGVRLSSMLLWLATLISAGVFIGADMYMGGDGPDFADTGDIARSAVVGIALLAALIAQFTTGGGGGDYVAASEPAPAPAPEPTPEPVREPLHEPAPEPREEVRDEPAGEPFVQDEPERND